MLKKIGIVAILFTCSISLVLGGCTGSSSDKKVKRTPEPEVDPIVTSFIDEKIEIPKENITFLEGLENEENNFWNLNQRGLIARQGDYIYYSDEIFGSLYKIKLDGTESQKLDSVPNVENINIYDGWIYYISKSYTAKGPDSISAGGKLYRIKTDGTSKQEINRLADRLIIEKGELFYVNARDGFKLYKVGLAIKDDKKLSDDKKVRDVFFANDWIYYVCETGLYKMKYNGTSKTKEIDSNAIKKFGIVNDIIYYMLDGKGYLYKANLNDIKNPELMFETLTDFIIKGEDVYFKKTSGANIYKYIAKENNSSDFCSTGVGKFEFSILGNAIYYSGKYKDDLKLHGYNSKVRLDKDIKTTIAIEHPEAKVGFNNEKLIEYVSKQVKNEDRNIIMKNIQKNVVNFFDGNISIVDTLVIDYDVDRLDEMVLIYKQKISGNEQAIKGIEVNYDSLQLVLTMLKWDAKELKLFPYAPISALNNEILGQSVLKPKIIFKDILKGGNKELIIGTGSGIQRHGEAYKIDRSFEIIDQKDNNIKELIKNSL